MNNETRIATLKVIFISTATFSLAACQTPLSDDLNARIAGENAYISQEWQSLSDAATQPQNWQSLFNDPVLASYLEAAEKANLDLIAAEARLRQSSASLRQSRALLGPTIRADASATGLTELSDLSNTSDSASASISASWDPDIFGVNRDSIRQSEALFKVQRANNERLRRVILSQTARAYIQIIEADQQLLLAQENLTFIEETKRVSDARFNAGDIARSDLALAELEFENAVAGLRNQEFAARSARRSLSILLGDFGDDDLTVANALPEAAALGTTALPSSLLDTRNDILAARAQLAADVAALSLTRKSNWPSLTFSGRLASTGADLSDIFDPDAYIASLAASLGGILFDSGRNAAQIDAAQARIDTSLAVYASVLRNAVFEVNDAFDRMMALRAALAALERASASAEEALALEQIKFDLGETILLDVLTVQRRVNAIRGSRISTERRLLDAQIDAYLALGANP